VIITVGSNRENHKGNFDRRRSVACAGCHSKGRTDCIICARFGNSQKQIEKATEKMAAYRYDDWRGLYNDCTSLYRRVKPSNIGIETNEWPTRVVYLQPAYVWVNEECISMNWTGGFDDFSLYLYVYRQNGMLDGAPVTPGVYIVDTRGKLPAHPYDLMGSRTNQAPAATGSPAPN